MVTDLETVRATEWKQKKLAPEAVGFRGHVSQSHWTEAVGASYLSQRQWESETGGFRVSVSQSHGTEAVDRKSVV